ncbi:MAG TPA: hypothetical protein DCP28_23785, partial [Cytophagales bacterium]|nr:hypothetical protein [Cytophagales bacterium]
RFDGYEFLNFTKVDGLPDNTIFNIDVDHDGHVWFLGFNNQLAYYDPASELIVPYAHNEVISRTPELRPVKRDFTVLENHQVALSLINSGIHIIDSGGHIQNPMPSEEIGKHGFRRVGDTWLYYSNYYGSAQKDDQQEIYVLPDTSFHLKGQELINTRTSYRSFAKLSDGTELLAIANVLFIIDPAQKTNHFQVFPHQILQIFISQSQDVWLGFRSGGALRTRLRDNQLKTLGSYFDGQSIIPTLEDREGNLWFGSLGNGIHMVPNVDISAYQKVELGGIDPKTMVTCPIPGGNTLVANFKSEVSLLTPQGVKDTYRFHPTQGCATYDLWYDTLGDQVWLATPCHGIEPFYVGGIQVIPQDANYIIPINTDTLLFLKTGATTSMSFANRRTREWDQIQFPDEFSRYGGGHPLDSGGIILTSRKGLFYVDIDKPSYTSLKGLHPFFGRRLKDILPHPEGGYWISSGEDGLLYYSSDTLFPLNRTHGLPSDNIQTMAWQGNTLWVGTKSGLTGVHFKSRLQGFTLSHLTTKTGLLSNEINHVCPSGDSLVIATQKGLSVIKTDQSYRNPTLPYIYLNRVRLNGTEKSVREPLKIRNENHTLQISYTGLAFKNQGEVNYRYKLEPYDGFWTETQETNVQYTSLPPGAYTFRVTAQNNDGVWSTQEASLKLHVPTPIRQTWWFISLVSLAIVAGFVGILRYRLNQQTRRNDLENKILSYRNRALTQQMNPHFIFNSLNSIQRYILNHDSKASFTYLGKFAKLMRQTLDMSLLAEVPLSEELKTLEIYLQLEVLRTKDHVKYYIEVEEDVEADLIQIPPMIIQPYVENAIWHGLMPKEGGGQVRIHCSASQKHLTIVVSDDGVGLSHHPPKSTDTPKHHSRGMHLTQERLKALSELYKNEMTSETKELRLPDGASGGTQVTIKIPLS